MSSLGEAWIFHVFAVMRIRLIFFIPGQSGFLVVVRVIRD
jgi:hypothetical protein